MPIKIWRRGGSAESRKVSAGHDLLPQACDGETRRSHLRSAQVSPRKVGAKAECRGVRNGSRGRTKFRPSRSQRAVQSPQKKKPVPGGYCLVVYALDRRQRRLRPRPRPGGRRRSVRLEKAVRQ
jgi:hypothetical protein